MLKTTLKITKKNTSNFWKKNKNGKNINEEENSDNSEWIQYPDDTICKVKLDNEIAVKTNDKDNNVIIDRKEVKLIWKI